MKKDFLKNPTTEAIVNDALMKFMDDFYGHYKATIFPKSMAQQNNEVLLKRTYAKALLQMNDGKLFYPDANSTMRFSYGMCVIIFRWMQFITITLPRWMD